MPLLCKQRALYVKGCVIANGVMDSQGDTLHAEDIKKIFTSFNNQDNFEISHEEIPLKEVSLLENYISTADETIGTAVVPSGSWNCVIRVDNPEIQEKLLTGELGGLSLNNRIAPRCKGNLTGVIRYKDVADAECVIPLLISFVERGANGYGLHVYDYDAYIMKSKDVELEENGGKKMDFKEFWKSLKSLIDEVEAPEEEAPAIEKEEETEEEEVEVTAEEVVEETAEPVEETETEEEEPAVQKEDETAEEEASEEEPVIEKEDEATEDEEITEEAETESDLEARVAKLEEIVAKLTAEPEESEEEEESETPDPTVEPEDEDTPKITKSEKVIIESQPVEQKNYFQMSGRDPLTGKKLRN